MEKDPFLAAVMKTATDTERAAAYAAVFAQRHKDLQARDNSERKRREQEDKLEFGVNHFQKRKRAESGPVAFVSLRNFQAGSA